MYLEKFFVLIHARHKYFYPKRLQSPRIESKVLFLRNMPCAKLNLPSIPGEALQQTCRHLGGLSRFGVHNSLWIFIYNVKKLKDDFLKDLRDEFGQGVSLTLRHGIILSIHRGTAYSLNDHFLSALSSSTSSYKKSGKRNELCLQQQQFWALIQKLNYSRIGSSCSGFKWITAILYKLSMTIWTLWQFHNDGVCLSTSAWQLLLGVLQ